MSEPALTRQFSAEDEEAQRLAEVRAYLGFDEESRAALAVLGRVLAPHREALLDRFYAEALRVPRIKELMGDRVEGNRAALGAHLERLWSAGIDAGFAAESRRSGEIHAEIGLDEWYVSAYGWLLAEMVRLRFAAQKGFRRDPKLAAEIITLIRAVFLDLTESIRGFIIHFEKRVRGAFDQAVAKLDENVQDTVKSVSGYGEDMLRAADTTADVGAEVRREAEAAAQAAANALAAAQGVAAAVEELHASIGEISSQVGLAARTAQQSVAQMEKAGGVVAELGQAAEEIGAVVSYIADIASQTNLLALNATIEAARAGAAGKGFAVVASEVKNLANQARRSTEDIQARILRIQEVARVTSGTIGEASQTISEMEQIATAVAAAVEEQTAATQEIGRHTSAVSAEVGQVSDMVSRVVGAARRAAEAAETARSAAEQMNQVMQTLGPLFLKPLRSSSEALDRRKHRRRALYWEAELALPNGRQALVLVDLSEQGAHARSETALPVGARGVLSASGFPPGLTAEVLTCRKAAGAGYFESSLAFRGGEIASASVDAVAARGFHRMIELAISDHRGYVERIRAVLDGKGQTRAASLPTHHTCRLGRWYDGVSDGIVTALPAFSALTAPHQEVHEAGRRTLRLFEAGDVEGAERAYAELEAASRRVIEGLEALRRDYDGAMRAAA